MVYELFTENLMGEDWLKLLKTFYAWKEIILDETFQKILIMLWMGSFKTLFFFL